MSCELCGNLLYPEEKEICNACLDLMRESSDIHETIDELIHNSEKGGEG